MDDGLRVECQNLLEQLRLSQELMKFKISEDKTLAKTPLVNENDPIQSYNLNRSKGKSEKRPKSKFGKDLTGFVNVSKDADTDLKPSYARNKLSSLSGRESQPDQVNPVDSFGPDPSQNSFKGKENRSVDTQSSIENNGKFTDTANSFLTQDTAISSSSGAYKEYGTGDIENVDDACFVSSSSWQPATPNTQRRRQLIDRHVPVSTSLDARELKGLDNERLLNFSYSHINVDDNVTNLDSGDKDKTKFSDTAASKMSDSSFTKNRRLLGNYSGHEERDSFQKQLTDDGNNRKLNNFIKDTTVKPKSILNSSAYYSLNSSKKNNSRVRFNTSRSMEEPVPDHRMLGYDWIAALLDNDPSLINQSESFFDDIKDFRKAYKDECSNKFYMESPYTLVDYEPAPVVEALTEPKVRPYVVNDRLFTEPFRPDLINYDEDPDVQKRKGSNREPTKDNPRFVRVSIPRSTLQTPYRVKPHRRGSFDGVDSFALMEHCLMGWENTRPAMLPSAQSVDLNTEAGTRVDSVTTTLAEAERQATAHSQAQWPFAKPTPRQQTLPTWRKQYMNTTLNLSVPSDTSSVNGSGSKPGEAKRVTDRLLNATYSTMYEMERLKQERELERKRNEEEERKK